MDDSNARKFQKELNGGLVGLVLLAILENSQGDLYGYEIAKRLALANEGTSIFKEGTIYPVLRALSAGELLTSPQLYESLAGSLKNLEDLLRDFNGNPRKYLRVKVF